MKQSNVFPRSMTVKQAVISTLAYFDLFEVPLTREEISEHFFFSKADEKKIDIYLNESPIISYKDGYFGLKQSDAFYEYFNAKRNRSMQYWKRVRRYQWLFNICPFIKLIAVCNSLPIRDTDTNSDIDLFVIVESGRMFTARFFLTIFTTLLGVRRHGKKVKKRFCLSFYITEEAMDFEEIALKPYDIYLAYWLKTLEPISGEYEVYKKFIHINKSWLKAYFHTISLHKRRFRNPKKNHIKIKKLLEKYFTDNKWELRFKSWQLKRAKEKSKNLEDKSGTVISEKMLKFHNFDARENFRKEWVAKIEQFL